MHDQPRAVMPGDGPSDRAWPNIEVLAFARSFAADAARVVEIFAAALQPFVAALNDLGQTPPRTAINMRRALFLARWEALTPRQRKDLLRRRRKGMRL